MVVDLEKLRWNRIGRARKMLKSAGLDAVLVTAWDNIRYVTGAKPYILVDWYTDAGAALLPAEGSPAIVGGLLGYVPEDVKVYGAWKIYPDIPSPLVPNVWVKAIKEALEETGIRKGKIGVDYLPIATLRQLEKELPKTQLVPALDEILESRIKKDPDELELLQRAAAVVDEGMQAGLRTLKPGVTERQVCAKMVAAMTEAGSEMLPWTPCCSSGDYNHLLATDYRLKEGDAIRWDIGCMVEGYVGDASRTGLIGNPRSEVRRLYSAVLEAQMNGIKAVQPGAKASDVDRAIRETIRAKGYPDYATSMGHGLGLRVFDLPWIAPKEAQGEIDRTLEPGMVLSIEPESYSGKFFVRLEDMVAVTETGSKVLTKTEYLNV